MHTQPNKETTLLREQQVWDLRIRCYSQQQIAQQLGISQSAVSQILQRVRNRLAQQYLEGALQMRIDQAEQLIHIAQEALAAWEASKQSPAPPPAQEEPIPPPAQDPTPTSAPTTAQQDTSQRLTPNASLGKPAYLRTALQALAAVRAIWGLEAAEKARTEEPQQGIKMLIGVDYDSLKNQDGVHVPRKEVERIIGQRLE